MPQVDGLPALRQALDAAYRAFRSNPDEDTARALQAAMLVYSAALQQEVTTV